MRRALFLAPLLLAACSEPEPEELPPDVVVVLLDTLRADALSIYGADRQVAPFLAELANDSVVFDLAWSTSTWTAPATASILTGCYPDRHGVTRGFLAHFREEEGGSVEENQAEDMDLLAISRNAPTLAERFKEHGYATFGMATNINIGDEMEFDRGFDRFERLHQAPAKDMRAALLEWKSELDKDWPSFLYLHFNDVHEPYHLRPRYFKVPDDPQDEVAVAYAHYQSEIGYVDSFLRKLYSDLNWGENTIVVVVADHGEEFMDHGQMAHEFTLFSELSRVPLMIHGEGVTAGRFDENVSIIDIGPTLFDLVDRPAAPDSFDGRSLADLCRRPDKRATPEEETRYGDRPLILHRYERGEHLWGVVHGGYKLIEVDEDKIGLFDLVRDPGEKTNIASKQSERVAELTALLNEHRARKVELDSAARTLAIDPEMLERLKSLGYVK